MSLKHSLQNFAEKSKICEKIRKHFERKKERKKERVINSQSKFSFQQKKILNFTAKTFRLWTMYRQVQKCKSAQTQKDRQARFFQKEDLKVCS